MKNIKRLFVNLMAVVLTCAVCLSASACKTDIRRIKLNVSVYNYEESVSGFEDVTLTINLYRHIAPKTVDAILGYVRDGYYNNTLFYKMSSYSNQIMVGDLKIKDGNIENNDIKPELPSEFAKGGRVNSNLTNVEGSIGLWRSWYAWNNNSFDQANASMKSGRATWYMPTSSISSYNDWFCVFAVIDLTNEDNSEAWELVKNAISQETETYTVYYTGEYDAQSPNKNDGHGLDFNCVKESDFVDSGDVFKASTTDSSKAELVCYNQKNISVPVVKGGFSAYIKSAVIA